MAGWTHLQGCYNRVLRFNLMLVSNAIGAMPELQVRQLSIEVRQPAAQICVLGFENLLRIARPFGVVQIQLKLQLHNHLSLHLSPTASAQQKTEMQIGFVKFAKFRRKSQTIYGQAAMKSQYG